MGWRHWADKVPDRTAGEAPTPAQLQGHIPWLPDLHAHLHLQIYFVHDPDHETCLFQSWGIPIAACLKAISAIPMICNSCQGFRIEDAVAEQETHCNGLVVTPCHH
jgi:hypothetical protein